ncbi:hypothetical protein VNO78_15283 [Psophocarpus tetragonolobus]|uniref:Uncharacterized protein n=1 Tax=Psophocarpus tetragonolobus TaxID=3891 RepID=A0AAN9SF35_PSOTE
MVGLSLVGQLSPQSGTTSQAHTSLLPKNGSNSTLPLAFCGLPEHSCALDKVNLRWVVVWRVGQQWRIDGSELGISSTRDNVPHGSLELSKYPCESQGRKGSSFKRSTWFEQGLESSEGFEGCRPEWSKCSKQRRKLFVLEKELLNNLEGLVQNVHVGQHEQDEWT